MRGMTRARATNGILCVASALIILAILVGKSCPFSPLFSYFNTENDTLSKAQKLNHVRYKKAMDYFSASKEISKKEVKAKLERGHLDIVVAIVTVARVEHSVAEPSGYLIQTAASVDAMLKMDTGTLKSMLVVCNVEVKPGWHRNATYLQKYIPYINRKGSDVVNVDLTYKPTLQSSKLADKKRRREIEDYVFCLNATRNLNSSYVIMLEDDVIPERDMLQVVEHTLTQRFKYRRCGDRNVLDKFAFIKLYYPQRWQGFAFEGVRLLEILCFGVVGGVVFVIICKLIYGPYTAIRIKVGTYLFWIAACILLAQMIGRVALLELRRLSPCLYKFGPSPGCCTQAMLYPTHVLTDLTQFLLVNAQKNKDLAIDDFTVENDDMQGYQLEPNLFKHTGLYTSLSISSGKDPREFLFDMPFDLND